MSDSEDDRSVQKRGRNNGGQVGKWLLSRHQARKGRGPAKPTGEESNHVKNDQNELTNADNNDGDDCSPAQRVFAHGERGGTTNKRRGRNNGKPVGLWLQSLQRRAARMSNRNKEPFRGTVDPRAVPSRGTVDPCMVKTE